MPSVLDGLEKVSGRCVPREQEHSATRVLLLDRDGEVSSEHLRNENLRDQKCGFRFRGLLKGF